MDTTIVLDTIKGSIDFCSQNWDIISVFVIGIISSIKAHSLSKFIQTAVTVAEMSFEKMQAEDKLSHVLAKINAKYPMIYFILGKTVLTRLVNKTVKELQEHIGTTSDRILLQANQLKDTINKDIIEHTKEITAKILASNITNREFFGDFNLASNEQVHEELRKLLEDGKAIVNRISCNLNPIKEKLFGKLDIK